MKKKDNNNKKEMRRYTRNKERCCNVSHIQLALPNSRCMQISCTSDEQFQFQKGRDDSNQIKKIISFRTGIQSTANLIFFKFQLTPTKFN